MEYDSRPKTRLFALKDEKGETKELFFVGRKVMVVLGVVFALIIGVIVHFFSDDIWIAIGVAAAVGLPTAFFPVYSDMKQEEYFSPLINKIIELLHEFGIDLTKQNVMDLLSFKEFRIDDEYVLVSETKNGELITSVVVDKVPENTKEKKPTVFPVVVNDKTESDFKPKVEPAEVEKASEETDEIDSTETVDESQVYNQGEAPAKTSEKATEGNVPVTFASIPASKHEYTATATGAMDVVAPLTMPTPVIGEIAPGVTGPIPMTVGDGSVVYEEPVAPSRGRHGRRSAVQ